MKHFVLGTNHTTSEQDVAFHALLKATWPDMGWWHQLSEVWLFVDPSESATAQSLRDLARKAFPGIYIMVIEVSPPTNWAGFGITEGNVGDMFTWMHKWWKPQ